MPEGACRGYGTIRTSIPVAGRLVVQTNGLFQPRTGLPERGVNDIVLGLSTSSYHAVFCIGMASRHPEGA